MKKLLSLLMMTLLAVTAWAGTETITFADLGFENQQEVSSISGENFTISFDKGTNSNVPKYYTTGNAIRVYGGGFVTVTSTTKTFTSIEFTFASGEGSNAITSDVGTFSGNAWTGSASSVVFSIAGTSGHRRFTSVTVTYEDGTTSAVATPVITLDPEEGPYYEGTSVTATITCATTGATIFYSTDGENWTEGTTLTLTETTTISAKATLNNVVSSIAEKQVTFEPEPVVPTGEDIIFKYGAGEEFAQNNAEDLVPSVKGGVTITFGIGSGSNNPKWYSASNGNARVYNGNTITIDAGDKTINTVTFTYDGNYPLNSPTTTDGTWAAPVWTVNASTGVLNVKNTARISTITVNVSGEAAAVEAPVITLNPAEGPYFEGDVVTATFSCETEGATITYSINDGEWQEVGETPVLITETSTIKAKATLGDEESVVASKTVSFIKVITTAAQFNALPEGTDFRFDGELAVINYYETNTAKGYYTQDETGGILIFGSNMPEYESGDIIPAGFTGRRTKYGDAPEMINPAGMQASTQSTELVPMEATIADVKVENNSRYAVLRGATLGDGTIEIDGESVAIYNRFNVDAPADTEGKTFDVYGVISYYYNNQFLPMEYVEIVEPKTYPINVGEFENGSVVADKTEATIGETVTLTIAPDEGYELTEITVKAGYLSDPVVNGISILAKDWTELGEVELNKVDDTHYTFVVPEDLNYNDFTEFKVEATFTQTAPPTAIDSILVNASGNARFVNPLGQVSDRPFKGINIVIDGNKTYKIVVK